MREIGAVWHIGVFTEKPCTYLVKAGSFSALSHYKKAERFEEFRNRIAFFLLVLMPPRGGFL